MEEGYFTVEAAWITSFSCMLFLFIMVVTVYFYDVGVVTASLQEDMTKVILEEEELSAGETLSGGTAAKQRVIMSEIKEYHITLGTQKITGTAKVCVGFPIPILREWLGKVWENQIEIQIGQERAADYMRKHRIRE